MCVVGGGQGLGRALMPDVFVVGHVWPTYGGQFLWWVKTHPANCEGGQCGGLQVSAAVMDTARVARNPSPALPHGGGGCGGCFAHLFLSRAVWCAGAYPTNCEGGQCGGLQASAAVRDSARVARNPSPALPHGGGDISAAWAQPRMVTAFMISSTPKRWPSCD